jgi:anthranilate synthase/aminodeoxychorismate synthase-like glutamine amidotransferase
VILLIDNYDSFVFNLARYFEELGETTVVARNDSISVEDALSLEPSHIVLSPGPCTPDESGICVDLVRAVEGRVPTLGVCLGHQCLASAFGARIVRGSPVHGKLSEVIHDGSDLFVELPNPLQATRYHALVVEPGSLPRDLVPLAHSADATIMALRHRSRPLWGVQFHPEACLTEAGHALLANFLALGRNESPLGLKAQLSPHELPPSGVKAPRA